MMNLFIQKVHAKSNSAAIPTIPRPDNMPGSDGSGNGLNYFIDYIGNFSISLIGSMGILAVLFVIFGAVKIIISGGDDEKSSHGWKTIIHAVLGIIVAGLSYAIVQMVVNLPGEIVKPEQENAQELEKEKKAQELEAAKIAQELEAAKKAQELKNK
jgi:hypothetical protein